MAPGAPEPVVVAHGYVLDIVPLLRWPGNRGLVVLDETLHDLSVTAATARSVRGELHAESMSDSLTVSGTLDIGYAGECRRCLEPTEGELTVDVHEVFEREPVEGETYQLPQDTLDLEPMVIELVLLNLPLAPLCADDCKGPAPEDFPAEVAPDEDESAPGGDPRWAALDALTFDD